MRHTRIYNSLALVVFHQSARVLQKLGGKILSLVGTPPFNNIPSTARDHWASAGINYSIKCVYNKQQSVVESDAHMRWVSLFIVTEVCIKSENIFMYTTIV